MFNSSRLIPRVLATVMLAACLGGAAAEGSLIGFWKLDDTTLPTAGATVGPNGLYDGLAASQLQQPPSPGDLAGNSVEMDGSPERINLGASGGIVSGQSALTMSMWVKVDNLGQDNTFASIGTFGGGSPLIFWRDDDDQGSSKSNTIAVLIGADRTVGESGVLNDNLWHHVAFTYEGSTAGGLQLYIDGAPTGPADTTSGSAIAASTGILALGNASISPASSKQFDGLMDEVAIWDKALSAGDIAQIASGVSPQLIPEPTTLLIWSLLAGLGVGLRWRRRK